MASRALTHCLSQRPAGRDPVSIDTWENKSLVLRLRQPRDRVRGHPPQPRPRGGGGAARRRGVELRLGHCQTRFALDGELVLATPETFMNRSGYAARCLIEHYGLDPAPAGRLRRHLSPAGGAADSRHRGRRRPEGDGFGPRVPADAGDRPVEARYRSARSGSAGSTVAARPRRPS